MTSRQLGVDRTSAITRVVEARKAEAVAPIERSGPQIPEAPEAPAAEAAPSEAKPADPAHLVELERRERALDTAKHEHELTRRELDQLKMQFKDPESALRAAGFTVEGFVERWLNGGKPTEGAKEPAPPAPEHALEQRIKQLEAERETERAQSRARSRRQEIEAMIPSDSDEFDVTNGLGALDQFMSELSRHESTSKSATGPLELKNMLTNFEQSSRKNVTDQIGRLAKTKFGRKLLAELLQGDSKTPQTAHQTELQTIEPHQIEDSGIGRRVMELRGRTHEQLREAAKQRALINRGL